MIRGCATIPGFAAAQREHAKLDAGRASSQPVSRLHGGAHTTRVPNCVIEDDGRADAYGRQGQA